MRPALRLTVSAVILSLAISMAVPTMAAPVLYTVSSNGDDQLRTVDPLTALTLSSVTITLAGETVTGGTGLATNPLTNELYALLTIQGQSGRELVKLNPKTGVATTIGDTGRSFAGLAFDATGVLYGVTGDGGSPSETLFTINPADATSTLKVGFGAGDDGEAIAFSPLDGLLYHASGHIGDCAADRSDGVCFESLDVGTLGISPIDINGTALVDEEAQALTFWASQGVFLWKQDHGTGPLFRVTSGGVPTLIGDLDHQAKGLAFLDVTVVPVPPSLALLGLGLVGLAALRRRR